MSTPPCAGPEILWLVGEGKRNSMAQGMDKQIPGTARESTHSSDVAAAAAAEWRLSLPQPDRSAPESPRSTLRHCLDKCKQRRWSATPVDEFYQQQTEMLDSFSKLDRIDQGRSARTQEREREERDKTVRAETIAIWISNVTNMVLFAAKVYASIRSRSLAIIASTLDSLLDLLSGFILWFAAFSMKRPNPYVYPIGKKRMQPLGILVFASVMATLGLEILLESGRQLISQSHDLALDGSNRDLAIGIMVSVTIVKFVLMIYCQSFKNEIVRAYAQDHFFDVITNAIGLVAAMLAARYAWWIDPVGAIVLALYTIRTWSLTVLDNVRSLVGRTASPDYLQKITYLCWNHDKGILQIDTVRAYTFGSHYFAEVDIVLPRQMPLQQAHDIGESLQNKLESLPDIERAFVHLDYEVSHRPEHSDT